ncbi:DEAD/DEAH box helicase, partial [SAR202 cluster bacterium AD-812-D07_MRT_10900m]|nr:DEAD/DEAH box helicase [SAR202 cluster bacterium AD-812-D07_MRT_10900m]
AGWALNQERDTEYEVSGMPNPKGTGFVDYVLWGDDGKPLGLVEAKRTRRSPKEGQRQAELYADCLEAKFGQRPVIFYTNGYEHWIWDDQMYPPRQVQGFYKKVELELLIQRRNSRKDLATVEINESIVGRYYQTRAIRNIGESFQNHNDRKALLAMATGSGKTRTVIALVDLLTRCNWAKRVLFLADRVALVNQAVNAFKQQLPDTITVNLIGDKETDGRVFVSTYPTMMGLIDESVDGERRFGPGHFDLVVIDEAHRSVFQKYGSILKYFDSLLVGLTATPREDVDHNTYGLFDLEIGQPTDAYSLEEAVADGFLVPPQAVSVPTQFLQEGIEYADLGEQEKERWDELEWDDQGNVPDSVSATELNRWLFNEDTVDKVLEHLMTKGQKVAGGDRLGKTIIFAKNQDHADFIQERFDVNYPKEKGSFARTITFRVEYAQSLIDDFSVIDPPRPPHIAISVDMLDTGIDIPEVLNLVFFKQVRSKTKFWQMVGRGTRLRPDIFGPGEDKQFFYLFDFCGNLEFFGQPGGTVEGSSVKSLRQKLFESRIELITQLDRASGAGVAGEAVGSEGGSDDPTTDAGVRSAVAVSLQAEVAAMNTENFVVRPSRRSVERFAKPEAWTNLSTEDIEVLQSEVAGLPSELDLGEEEAKRFDHLLLRLQLALLRSAADFEPLRKRLMELAGLLEEKDAIPLVKAQIELIGDVQSDEWWQDVTVPMLESVRRKLRLLVRLIDRNKKKPVYTNFEDIIGEGEDIDFPGLRGPDEFVLFRQKARSFLREHMDIAAVYKLRMNIQLTTDDLDALEETMKEIGSNDAIRRAADEAHGLGLFARALVGLDREAATAALSEFTAGSTMTANQITFANLVVERLAEHGLAETRNFYDPPFTDVAPEGPQGLFSDVELGRLREVLDGVRNSAVAAGE